MCKTGSRTGTLSATLPPMTWSLRCPDGQLTTLPPGVDLWVGSTSECALQLRGNDVPERLARVSRANSDIWLHVLAADPPVALNGRPVRALARAVPGDRLCFGTFCVDVVGDSPHERAAPFPVEAFALRVRGGTGSGELHHGPIVHLDAQGTVVSPAAGTVELSLVDGEILLSAGGVAVHINGHGVDTCLRILPNDQIQIGPRRFIVETAASLTSETVAPCLPALSSVVLPMNETAGAENGSENGSLWWLIAIAALIAVSVAALLYFHR